MSEQAKVGLIVLVAGTLLVITVLSLTGLGLRGDYVSYKTYLKYAGGLQAGAPVRYGGLQVGRVEGLRIDPENPTQIEIQIEVRGDTPVRGDSVVTIAQQGLLSENHLEIQPGKSGESLPAGSAIPSVETEDMAAMLRRANQVLERAGPLLDDLHKNLNQISERADVLLANLGQVTGPENQKRFNHLLAEADTMITATSPRIQNTIASLETSAGRLDPLIADLHTTQAKIDQLVLQVNALVDENRADFRASMQELSKTLAGTRELIAQLNSTTSDNSANIDATLANIRAASENLRQFTDTVKQRPYSLIRVTAQPDRAVPGAKGGGRRAAAATGGTTSDPR